MDGMYLRFLNIARSERIVEELQTQQHIAPHRRLRDALDRARASLGFCPRATQQAIQSLRLDPTRQIGRLKRSELIQLAHAIHRAWRPTPTTAPEPLPV